MQNPNYLDMKIHHFQRKRSTIITCRKNDKISEICCGASDNGNKLKLSGLIQATLFYAKQEVEYLQLFVHREIDC